MRRHVLVVLLLACGSNAQPEARPETPPEPEPNEVNPPRIRPSEPEPTPLEVGWTELPAAPTAELRRANRRALSAHAQERFEQSRDAFAAILADSPNYANVRFNHACALARTDRLDDAADEVRTLWLRDLPTFGTRYDEDDDLEKLRESHGSELAAFRARVVAAYEARMARGIPVVYQTLFRADPDEADERRYAQAGVWLHDESRFVPMGPTRHEQADVGVYPHVATWFHAPQKLTLLASATSHAVDISTLVGVRLDVYRAPTGERIASHRFPRSEEENIFRIALRPTSNGLHYDAAYLGTGFVGARAEPEGPTISLIAESPPLIAFEHAVEGVTVTHRQLTIGEGDAARVVRFPTKRAPEGQTTRQTDVVEVGSALIVLAHMFVEVGLEGRGPGPYVASRVNRATGAIEEFGSGEGSAALMAAGEVAYLQLGERLLRVEERGEPTTLPTGLVLSPTL